MIQSMRKTSLGILAVILLTTGLTAHAQRRANRNSDRFEPIDNGRSLRVTRRTNDEGLTQPIVANSVYDKTSDVAQWNLYSGARDTSIVAEVPRGNFVVPDGTQLVAVLNDTFSPLSRRRNEDEHHRTHAK